MVVENVMDKGSCSYVLVVLLADIGILRWTSIPCKGFLTYQFLLDTTSTLWFTSSSSGFNLLIKLPWATRFSRV
jgi:hypothetical protein